MDQTKHHHVSEGDQQAQNRGGERGFGRFLNCDSHSTQLFRIAFPNPPPLLPSSQHPPELQGDQSAQCIRIISN